MADQFDLYLAGALAPAERAPDRRFMSRVQAAVALDERLRAERSALIAKLVRQTIALAAVATGLAWLGQSPVIRDFSAESPAILLAAVIAMFSFLVLLLGIEAAPKPRWIARSALSR